jgi:quinolinate synthase
VWLLTACFRAKRAGILGIRADGPSQGPDLVPDFQTPAGANPLCQLNKPLTPEQGRFYCAEITELKQNAVLVAQYYDRFAGAGRKRRRLCFDSAWKWPVWQCSPAQTVLVAGVKFMGETAVQPGGKTRVLMPTLEATCSLDLGCPVDEFAAFCDPASAPHRGVCQHLGGEGAG